MNTNDINKLLAKYYEGSTSSAEEQKLKEYFNSNELADEHKHLKPWFAYLKEESRQTLHDENFETKLWDKIEEKENRRRKIVPLYWISAAAATILLLLAIFMEQPSWEETTPMAKHEMNKEQQLAYAATKNTLMFVSGKLNQGLGKLEYLDEGEKAYEQLKKLDNLANTAENLQAVRSVQAGMQKMQPAEKMSYMKKYSMY
ncbi:MAG: hypothetical protein K9I94_12080 [Bacteroidales bacterium]|nr:hypothetical protein [Bacteroidales bacterium]